MDSSNVGCMQSQLRAKVMSELRAGGIIPIKRLRSPGEEAALLVVLDHLKKAGMKCTLSVFVPESGLAPDKDNVVRDETLQILGISQVRQSCLTVAQPPTFARISAADHL